MILNHRNPLYLVHGHVYLRLLSLFLLNMVLILPILQIIYERPRRVKQVLERWGRMP